MRKPIMLTGGIVLLALVATACPSSDGDDDTTVAGVYQRVKDRGMVVCGVNETVPGFGFLDEGGEYQGFDIDFCEAVAAAVFGDASKVEFRSVTADSRFPALQSGEIDVLIRNTTWTASRDGRERGQFVTTTFYDGQGMMVKGDSGFDSLEDLDGQTICVLSGTTTESNLESVFRSRNIDYRAQSLEDTDQIQDAFIADRCRGWTSDKSQLSGHRSNFPANQGGPSALRILEETMSKEPLGPVVLEGDADWFDVVNWTVLATIQAEEFGISSRNIDRFLDSEDPAIKTFLGRATVTTAPSASPGAPTPSPVTAPFNDGLDLPDDFAVQIIRAVGNYQEIYARNVGPNTPLGLVRGLNSLWTDGGLLYPPPYK